MPTPPRTTGKAPQKAFSRRTLHKRAQPRRAALGYLKRKSSFLIAMLSLVAFLAGNMMGEHGWHAFWASVLGAADDSLITYTGTVAPIALVPDYAKWSTYGGDGTMYTYRQVPQDLLIPLPKYDS